MVVSNDHVIVACETLASAATQDRSPLHWPNSLVVLDQGFQVVSEMEVESLGMGDLHELYLDKDRLYVVDTLGNRVVQMRIAFGAGFDSRPEQPIMVPLRQWVEPHALQQDACHVNSVTVHNGRILVSAFGVFSHFREYVNRGASGCIWDITDSFGKFGVMDARRTAGSIAAGLADPHSLTSYAGRLYWTESRRSSVICDGEVVFRAAEGYLRGMVFLPDRFLVGCSASRHAPIQQEGASIWMVDLETNQVIDKLRLPTREVFSLLPLAPPA